MKMHNLYRPAARTLASSDTAEPFPSSPAAPSSRMRERGRAKTNTRFQRRLRERRRTVIALKRRGHTVDDIARTMQVHRTTVLRDIAREMGGADSPERTALRDDAWRARFRAALREMPEVDGGSMAMMGQIRAAATMADAQAGWRG